ncbi:HAD-like domain-containing protein [Choanephora cucurbitarum]|nr:HAD-like domain-containing protein [Choanephora cucurbitarum]
MLEFLGTKEQREAFIDQYDNFLFDCDGVLWEGTRMFDGVKEAMTLLREKGKRVFFVTNNSTKSRSSFLKKFEGFGIKATQEEVFSSAFATASYLKHVLKFPQDKKVYIIGMNGIRDELAAEGIRSCGGEEDSGLFDNEPVPDDEEVGAVVIGLDTQVNYKKYAKAFAYLQRNKGCHFIVTNEDSTFPQHGAFYPGAGSIAAPIITALGRRPDAVLGKPAQNMLEAIFAEYKLDPKKTCMIGDRLDTDIEFGLNGGIDTLCVLTGITTKEKLLSPDNKVKSTYYMNAFEWKEAFSLYDKKGNSTVSSANLGDLLRGLGQNPTQAEVAELVKDTAKSKGVPETQEFDIDFGTFLSILTRPDGFKPAGTSQEFIQGFQVFDKEGDGYISAGELRYVLTNLGEKLTEDEVNELLKEVEVGKDGRINYVDFVTVILSN